MQTCLDLTVLLLTLDEADCIGSLLGDVSTVLARLAVRSEILIVDAGSSDQTREIAAHAGARIVIQARPGYGSALCEGFLSSRGRYIITLDADSSHPPDLIETLWQARERAEIIVGSRYIGGGSSTAPACRQILSRLLNGVFRRVLSVPVRDMSSGYRLYEKRILRPQAYGCQDFSILEEILVDACLRAYRAIEVPLHFRPRCGGASHVKFVKFCWSYLRALYKLWKVRNSVASADYDDRAYDSVIPLQRYWQRRRYGVVRRFLSPVKGMVLDIGCGSSRIIQALPQAVAFDCSDAKLRFLRPTNSLRVLGTLFFLPFADKSFDQVICSQVIEHVARDPSLFAEINRVMQDRARLVIGTPDYGRYCWRVTEFVYKILLPNAYGDEHITHYTRESLFACLRASGFRIDDFAYVFGGELIVLATKVDYKQDSNCVLSPCHRSLSSVGAGEAGVWPKGE